jgi:hypothetical protein
MPQMMTLAILYLAAIGCILLVAALYRAYEEMRRFEDWEDRDREYARDVLELSLRSGLSHPYCKKPD